MHAEGLKEAERARAKISLIYCKGEPRLTEGGSNTIINNIMSDLDWVKAKKCYTEKAWSNKTLCFFIIFNNIK